jgi:hypothetical protein
MQRLVQVALVALDSHAQSLEQPLFMAGAVVVVAMLSAVWAVVLAVLEAAVLEAPLVRSMEKTEPQTRAVVVAALLTIPNLLLSRLVPEALV